MGAMRVQQFRAHVTADASGRAVIPIPFDPDEAWGAKAFHPVGGTIQTAAGLSCGRRLRGRLTSDGGQWVFTLNPTWMRGTGVAVGDEVIAEFEPEGPQRADLAPDIASALEASPEAAAFFDTLAQFYRRAYLRWIDATTRRPDVRAARISEVVDLLAAGVKERPRR
jgi:Bacteriocin-protection, YdeI or OmpD-Associated